MKKEEKTGNRGNIASRFLYFKQEETADDADLRRWRQKQKNRRLECRKNLRHLRFPRFVGVPRIALGQEEGVGSEASAAAASPVSSGGLGAARSKAPANTTSPAQSTMNQLPYST